MFCLALPHHHSIVMTRALVVMIATHDSDLIVRGAVIIGIKQATRLHRQKNRPVPSDRTCAPSRCSHHAHFPMPAALMCTGMSSNFVNWPGMACPRDRSRYKTDTRKNEDGSVARDVSINGVPAFQLRLCRISGTSFTGFDQHEPHHGSPYPSSVDM